MSEAIGLGPEVVSIGFLIIGSMKSGTTSLFRDLGKNPGIFVPEDKEPDALISDFVLTVEGRLKYLQLFANSQPGQICGEASTSYTKLPKFEGAAERAYETCGPNTKIVYLVRDPIERIVSHHHHEFIKGGAGPDIDKEVRCNPDYVDFSRYMTQLKPWLRVFGAQNVKVIRFEDYLSERRQIVDDVTAFIGVSPRSDLIDASQNYNASDNKPVVRGLWRKIYRNRIYREYLRKLMPWSLRYRIRHVVLPKGASRPAPPSLDTERWLTIELAQEVDELSRFCGSHVPLWPRWQS